MSSSEIKAEHVSYNFNGVSVGSSTEKKFYYYLFYRAIIPLGFVKFSCICYRYTGRRTHSDTILGQLSWLRPSPVRTKYIEK